MGILSKLVDWLLGLFGLSRAKPAPPVAQQLGQQEVAAKVNAETAVVQTKVAEAAQKAPSTVKGVEDSLDKGTF